MKDLLAWVGGGFLVALITILFCALLDEFKEWIGRMRYDYKIKHRFDKPPTAKCYCRDCTHHGPETKRCFRSIDYRCTADNWFCWEADPRNVNNNIEEEVTTND